MACSHPLFSYWRTDAYGNRDKVFASNHNAPFIQKNGHIYSEKIELPCGQCAACRLEYSRQWAVRCSLEAEQWTHNYFVTLTYNESHVPYNSFEYIDFYTGEVNSDIALTLVPKDLQDFFKRLRINFKRKYDFPSDDSPGIRFYACGEYGGETKRPHYHLCLFNCPIPDLEVEAHNYRGDVYYSSEFLNSIWSDKYGEPIGFVTIGELSFDTCAYVARYMMKKHKGKTADYYKAHHIEPEFSRMSLKPGIARHYFDKNSGKIYKYDQIIVTGSDGKAKRVRPPRYYDKLYDIFSPEDLKRVKAKRIKSGKASRKQIEERTSLDRVQYLKVCEENLLSRIKSLKRTL